jgi:hypothetical protein
LMLHAPNADSNESQISIPLTVNRKLLTCAICWIEQRKSKLY